MTKLAAALAAVLLVCLPTLARADAPPQDAAENIVLLKLNGEVVLDSAVVLQSKDGDVWMEHDKWQELDLVLPADKTGLLSAKSLGILVEFDGPTQTVDLRVPGELLQSQILGTGMRFQGKTDPQPKGVMINYDLAGTVQQDGTWGLSLGHEARMGLARGTLISAGQLNVSNGEVEYVRSLTTWNKDFYKQGVIFQAGDVFSPRSNLASPVNLGGFRIASDRGLRQGEQFFPVPLLGGVAQTTSSAQLQVNGNQLGSYAIQPGPWQLNSYSTRKGTNELAMVIRDEFGREQLITERFYVSPGNLPKGKTEFDVAVGLVRPDIQQDKYAEPAVSAKVEHGISDSWTLGATVQATEDSKNLVVSNRFILGRYGALSVDLAQSNSPEGKGRAFGAAYDYTAENWSIRASHTQYSPNHWMLADATSTGLGLGRDVASISSIGVGFRPKEGSWNVGANATSIDYADGTHTNRFEGVWRKRKLNDDYAVGLSYDTESKDKMLYATWRHSFGPNLSLSTQVKAAPELTAAAQLAGRNKVGGRDLRWNAGATYTHDSKDTTAYGNAAMQFDKGDLTASAYYQEENSRVDARWNGSIWIGEGGITTQRTTRNSFVLVEVPGQAGVPVSSGGGYENKTNKRGYAMVPDVQPLVEQGISLNTKDLSIEVGIENTTKKVVAPRLGGAKVVFPITSIAMREVNILFQGKPVVPPARLKTVDEEVVVGVGGVAVLSSPEAGERISVQLSSIQTCAAVLPDDLGSADSSIELDCKETP